MRRSIGARRCAGQRETTALGSAAGLKVARACFAIGLPPMLLQEWPAWEGTSQALPLCARHGVDAGGASPLRARVSGTASRRQLRRSDPGWGGSRRPSSELTNRNRIQGLCGGVTRQWTGTPDDHPDTRTRKSGSARAKQQRLTLGDLPASPDDPEQGAGDGVRRVGRSQPRS